MSARSLAPVLALVLNAAACRGTAPEPVIPGPIVIPNVAVTLTEKEATVRIEARASEEVVQTVADSFSPSIAHATSMRVSYGSGFLVKHQGEVRAITNHHVVGDATKVTILLDGDLRIDGDVVYVDARRDIAIIAVKATKVDLPIVELDTTPLRVDEDVRASGYPGVATELSYRLTRGAVSNVEWAPKELRKGTHFIQHTSAIDPGSSGGPLFRRDSLRVVGVNTLKVPMNESLFAAVPASDVLRVLEDASAHERPKSDELTRQRVTDACEAIIQELGVSGEPSTDTLELLSDRFAVEAGAVAVSGALQHGSYDYRDYIMRSLHRDALEGTLASRLRMDGYYMLKEQLGEQLPAQSGCGSIVDADVRRFVSEEQKDIRVRVPLRASSATLRFVLEQGFFRLADVDAPPPPAAPALNPAPGVDRPDEEYEADVY